MARGDGGKAVFETDHDRKAFLSRLGEACASHGWRVHAWVLMGNHFHLLLETPQANLVSGMKWLMGTFSQGWNRARLRRGHVFQGRYRAIPVNGSEADGYYFRIVADYIHLNPARAGLAGGEKGKLSAYRWSSFYDYAKGKGTEWLEMERLLRAFELAGDTRGRRGYVMWLEERAKAGGEISAEAMASLRRGWYLGEESFKDRLLAWLEKPDKRRNGNLSGGGVRDRSLKEAERLVLEGTALMNLPAEQEALMNLKKGNPGKVVLAWLLRTHTTASNGWIAERLGMGCAGSVSRLVGSAKTSVEAKEKFKQLEAMLK
ncbi:MAG: transposase [Luteolibacter sp.]